MDALKSLIHKLEERVFFLENEAEHNCNYIEETLGSLATRISKLEEQTSGNDKCDQMYVDGMIRNIADIFQDNIEEIFSKMDDFEVQLEYLNSNSGCDTSKLKNITSESESPVLMLSKSACSYTKSEAQEEPSFVETKSRQISTSISDHKDDIVRGEDKLKRDVLVLEDGLLSQSMALGKCLLISQPTDNIDIQTLKHINYQVIPNVKKQCVDLQKSSFEYSKVDTASASIVKHVTEVLYAAEVWICSMNEQVNKKLIDSSAGSTSSRSPKNVCNIQYPCVMKGHQHSIAECKEFFLQSPQKRVINRKSFDFKYCTVCLQSNSYCRYRRCSNLKFIPQILVCRECKLSSRTEGKGYYSVFYCLNKKHSKPSHLDISKALLHYLPDYNMSWMGALDGDTFKWHDSNNNQGYLRVMNRKHSQDKLPVYSNSNVSYISSHDWSHFNAKDTEMDFSNHRIKIPQELNNGVSQFWNNLRIIENG